MENKFLVRLPIQFFSGEEFGAYDPATAYEGIEQANAETQTDPQVQAGDENQTGVQQPEGQQPQTEQQQIPKFLDFGGRKVPFSPELEGLHKDYLEQQRYAQQLNMQNQQYQQMMMQQAQMQQQAVQQPVQQQQEQLPQMGSEEWWEKFYKDPTLLIKQTESQIYEKAKQDILKEINPMLEPIVQEKKWNQEVSRVQTMFPDFQQLTPNIQQVLNARPELADMPNGLEYAYYQAKAQAAQAQPSPQQLLSDPQFQQQIMQDEAIRNQMINQYVLQKQQTNQQLPQMMGNQAGGHTPFTPQSSPKTLREASQMTMKQLGIRQS